MRIAVFRIMIRLAESRKSRLPIFFSGAGFFESLRVISEHNIRFRCTVL